MIENFAILKNMGVLSDRDKRSQHLNFRRYNLIYGFNGSGKSTVSRIFSSLQSGEMDKRLPDGATFQIQLGDKSSLSSPDKIKGMEKSVAVFNEDFVNENFRWADGKANPVFFIGADQTEAAAELEECEARSLELQTKLEAAETVQAAAGKALATFKRNQAKSVAERLHLGNRKYEAPALTKDYESWKDELDIELDDSQIQAAEDIRRLQQPHPELRTLKFDASSIIKAYDFVSEICIQSLSSITLDELEKYPEMVIWLKDGHRFHEGRELDKCLYCGNIISPERRAILTNSLDAKIDEFLLKISATKVRLLNLITSLRDYEAAMPTVDELSPNVRKGYPELRQSFVSTIRKCQKALEQLGELLDQKQTQPATVIKISDSLEKSDYEELCEKTSDFMEKFALVISSHNLAFNEFKENQEAAETAIRKHFVYNSKEEYFRVLEESKKADSEIETLKNEHAGNETQADLLRQKIRTHAPAAEAINRLVSSYLGHKELSIVPLKEGYALHRFGEEIEGAPSEGEKTAIAVSYFLSSMEADGKKLKDLIVVIDDPVSSLDSKALNYACSLIKSRLSGAKQLFILTHNQQCMNEFRKAWKSKARPQNNAEPTATFLFLDVSIPEKRSKRETRIIEMSKLLREYDSEYHYLMGHVLEFTKEPTKYYDYSYMMPNVLRRVMDVFLAFKCPGSSGLVGQIDKICKDYPKLDKDRLTALERLAQVESHSDNLDDLLSFSSMTLEETRDAAEALIGMMEEVDGKHLASVRKLCG